MDRQRDWLDVSIVEFSTICSEARSAAAHSRPAVGPGADVLSGAAKTMHHRQEARGAKLLICAITPDLRDHATRLTAPIEFRPRPVKGCTALSLGRRRSLARFATVWPRLRWLGLGLVARVPRDLCWASERMRFGGCRDFPEVRAIVVSRALRLARARDRARGRGADPAGARAV